MKLGILPLGRSTFDVAYAGEKLSAMLAALDGTGHDVVGPRDLLVDEATTRDAIGRIADEGVDRLLILQVTFTDAAMTIAAAAAVDAPLAIWAVPEPRAGGRLRLNAFCGLNLASHAMALNGRSFAWAYGDAEEVALDALLTGPGATRLAAGAVQASGPEGEAIAARLRGRRIARIGAHPAGFDTCAYDAGALSALAGIAVDELELPTLFDRARGFPTEAVVPLRAEAATIADGMADVDQDQLDRSLRLKLALDGIRADGGYDAFALRCWPETFTEYGGAVCGPAAMLGEARVPCACEADVYGALTQMILAEAANAPVFLTDLVDVNGKDNSAVVWHCGQAPSSMRDEAAPATATIHTNRRMPLLFQFTLKPGRVTLMRISQAEGRPTMVLAGGEMLGRPMSFTGTSGVVRFDRPADQVLEDVIASGLEHHMALAYGDHRPVLRQVAGAMGLPVLEL